MRSWFLPVLPVALVAVAVSIAFSPSASGSMQRQLASDEAFQTLHAQAVGAMDSLRREIDPHALAAQYAK